MVAWMKILCLILRYTFIGLVLLLLGNLAGIPRLYPSLLQGFIVGTTVLCMEVLSFAVSHGRLPDEDDPWLG